MSLDYSTNRTSHKLSIFTQWKIRWFMKRREAIGYQYTYLEQADCKIYVTRLSYHLFRIRGQDHTKRENRGNRKKDFCKGFLYR